MTMRVVKIARDERPAWAGPIAALEAGARYPLGADHFRLDHGADYFAFFDRLGDVAYYAAVEDGEVLAVGAGVLRQVPGAGGSRLAWYICDLKVRPDRRGQHIPLRMFAAAFPPEFARCPRGYGISMDPPGRPNRVVGIFQRFPVMPIRHAATIELWSLDADAMDTALPVVREHRGEVGFLSLGGVKDIVLASTGAPLALRHVQFGPLAAPAAPAPTDGAVHMLATPERDALGDALRDLGHAPSATATVITLGMDDTDWRWVLTSDI